MNIAFSAVAVFLLLLPPVAFYISFSYGRFQKGRPQWGSIEVMMACIIFSMIMHAVAILFIYRSIRLDLIFLLLSGKVESIVEKCTNKELRSYMIDFSFYNAIQLAISVIAGRIFRQYLQRVKIHGEMEALRIYNHWWYLFNAFKAEGFLERKVQRAFDLVFVDVLVNTNSGSILYSGYLTDFICTGETLERLYLSESSKRDFKTTVLTSNGTLTVNKPGQAQSIKGEILTIPAGEIINVNVRFVNFKKYPARLKKV